MFFFIDDSFVVKLYFNVSYFYFIADDDTSSLSSMMSTIEENIELG